jgi:hypothetical protein
MFVGVHQATGPVNPVELIARAAVVHRRMVAALAAVPVQMNQAEKLLDMFVTKEWHSL